MGAASEFGIGGETMSGFTLFKRGECPICSGASKGCRKSESTELVFCRDNSANPTGYLYRGEDTWGFGLWQFSEDAEAFTQQGAEERYQQRQKFLAAEERQRQRQQQIARQMPAVERHKWYTKLLECLSLSESDSQNLLDRGFTQEQIINDGYKSVGTWQKVGRDFPQNLQNLPGLLSNGALNVPKDGILCPIRNHQGLIVGFQARLSEAIDGRYRWLSSTTKANPNGASPHLDGELPIGVFEPEQFNGDSIWLTEGTGFKPSLTRYRLDVPVVGAASGRFTVSPELSKSAVEYLSAKYKTKTLTFPVDAGDVANSCGVPERWREQFDFFSMRGYECRVAWWEQVTKDQSQDIDELTDFSKIEYISPSEFWEIVEKYRNNSSPKKEVPQTQDWAWENWLKSRKFTPHQIVNQDEFTFGKIPDSGVIVAAKSGLGTGKTKELIRLIKSASRGAVILGYRNNLLLQTGERASQSGLTLYHIREDGGIQLIADELTHQMLCLDSIRHVDGYFKGRDIYLDETCSVMLHSVNGGTLGDAQAKVLKIFTKALEDSNRVFLLDGNLSDIYVDFISEIAKNKRVIKIENQKKIAPHTIKFVQGIDAEGEIKQRDRSPLIQFMLDPDILPWIYCDSKERAKILYQILTDLGKKGFCLSSETSGEDWAKHLLSNPNEYISNNKPEFAIVTPTAESGVSITMSGHFTHKFSFFVGVASTNGQHQAMFRLRDNNIPHLVFCPERSSVRDRANPNTYSVKKFREILNDRIVQSGLLASQGAENSQRVLEVIGEAIARQNDDWWDFACRLGTIDNFEQDNLQKCLIHALEEAGHSIEILQWESSEIAKHLEKQAKEIVQKEHAKEVYSAVAFDSVEEAREKAKSSPRKEVQRRIEKTFLLDRLPGIEESEIWSDEFIYECHIKNRDFINQQQRFYMVNNFEVSQKRHEVNWFYQATNENFFSARVKRMSHDVIWALKELNITQFIGQEYHKNSSQVIDFINTLRKRQDIQLALRIYHLKPETSEGKERLEILGNLLNLIGFKNTYTGKKFVENIRLRHYKCETTAVVSGMRVINPEKPEFDLEAARLAILKAIECRFSAWMESEKSQVNWEPEPEIQVAPNSVKADSNPMELAAGILKSAETWKDITLNQQEVDSAWHLLTLEDQKRLRQMHRAWQECANKQAAVAKIEESAPNPEAPQQIDVAMVGDNAYQRAMRSFKRSLRLGKEFVDQTCKFLDQEILRWILANLSSQESSQYLRMMSTA